MTEALGSGLLSSQQCGASAFRIRYAQRRGFYSCLDRAGRAIERVAPQHQIVQYLADGKLVRVLQDWCQPFPGFFIYYPSRRQQTAALTALVNILRSAGEQESTESSSQRRKPTILVVDDQQMIADTTATVLNQSGFRAEPAYSGQAALEIALRLRPDYLLTDIVMPGMNGVELAIRVRNHLPTTVIVLFSGQSGITDLLRQAKVDGYEFNLLAKPIHPEKLLEHLKREAPHFWHRT